MSDNISQANLNEMRALLKKLPSKNEKALIKAQNHEAELTKPAGSLGKLEEISQWFASWQSGCSLEIKRPRVAVFAGNHGIAAQGVSAFPPEVTMQMVANFKAGGAAINQLCKINDAELRVYEMALDNPTEDFTKSPAMSEDECATAMAYGMMAVEDNIDILCLGEMGIANSSSAAAMSMALYGGDAKNWTGPGTGVSGDAFQNKINVVDAGVKKHLTAMGDGLDILRHLGGFELAAITGAVLAARMARIPVILDGYATTVAAAILTTFDPSALDHCIIGHLSMEPAHIKLLDKLNKKPILQMNMRLGEASGAALALGIVKSAIACHTGMATFTNAGVSNEK